MFLRISRKRSGQTTIEYILLVTAVVVLVIAFLAKNGLLAKGINQTLKLPKQMLQKKEINFTIETDGKF